MANNPIHTAEVTRQNGIALAVSLILLLMITILGISALNSSRLQTYIARNMHLKTQSFQNTESGLATREQQWQALIFNCLETPGTCPAENRHPPRLGDNPPGIPDIASINWVALGEIIDNAKVNIETLGRYSPNGDNDKIITVYRLTARGQDINTLNNTSTNTNTILQSLIRTCEVDVGGQNSPC